MSTPFCVLRQHAKLDQRRRHFSIGGEIRSSNEVTPRLTPYDGGAVDIASISVEEKEPSFDQRTSALWQAGLYSYGLD